jgi:hypothetical protein
MMTKNKNATRLQLLQLCECRHFCFMMAKSRATQFAIDKPVGHDLDVVADCASGVGGEADEVGDMVSE